MRFAVVVACCLTVLGAKAHTQSEELSVVEYLVRSIMCSPEWVDDLSVIGDVAGERILYDNYDDLFAVEFPSNHIGCSWTPQERRSAFENFLFALPDLSTNGLYLAVKVHGGIALQFCCDHGATNVLPAALNVLSARHSVAQGAALDVFREFAVPTETINDFVSSTLMNRVGETEEFRKRLLAAYSDVLLKHRGDCSSVCFTNGVSIVRSGVYGWAGAVVVDKLLLALYSEYADSSNRLVLAQQAIAADFPIESWWDWKASIREYFVPITNRLMSIQGPLPEVEELR